MTWHLINVERSKRIGLGVVGFVPRARVLLLSCALLAGAGCSSSKSGVSLEVTAPKADQTLTSKADDTDLDKPGVQFDVTGTSKGIPNGTAVELFIDDMKQASVDARVQTNGSVDIPDITLPPGTHKIYLRTATGSATSNVDQKYTLKAIEITAPDNDAVITKVMDEDSMVDGIQISVTVNTYAVDSSQTVTLFLDGQQAGTAKPDAKGKAVISGVTLLSGSHTLLARIPDGTGTLDSSEVKVSVQENCAAISFVSPAPPVSGSLTLGGAGKCPANAGDAFTASVQISTDAGDGRAVQVIVNGQTVASGKVVGATASFDGVAFNKRMGANTLDVTVENANGDLCKTTFPADILIDCAGPDCSIASPTPVPYVDGKGNTTLYLNHAKTASGGTGFDIQVASSSDIIGKDVQLIIDGNSRKPLTVPAVADGTASSATFAAVAFSEGPHTVEAVCTDATGNMASSGALEWVVDTQACGVKVTDPAAKTVFVLGDDTDSATSGTQVVATSTVTGSDCVGQRAKVCDPAAGITGSDFSSYDGTSPLLSTVTLSDAVVDQSLCVEVQDQARNVGRSSVAVSYRNSAPGLVFESPVDGQKFNAMGNGTGYIADAVPSTSTCDAAFSIACTEIGAQVELHQDSAAGALLASAECKARQSGDPAIPTGYAGRAKTTAAPFVDPNQDATLVATETLTGSSTKTITGTSDAIVVHGDCRLPQLAFIGDPCAAASSNQIALANAHRTFSVANAGGDSATVSVSVVNGTTVMPTPSATTPGQSTYTGVDFGPVGTVTLAATVTDGFDNTAPQLTCTAQIVTDLPTVAISTPASDNLKFGPGQSCNTGTAGQYGVHLIATADQQASRSAVVSVNGGTPIGVSVGAGGAIDACVPVSDDSLNPSAGQSTLVLKVTSTVSNAFAQASRVVHVHTLSTTAPPDNGLLLAAANANCAGSGFSYQVQVSVDPSLAGQSYSIASGVGSPASGTVSGSSIAGCVQLADGPNTITTTVNGATSAVQVTVVNSPPAAGIIINAPTFDTASVDYRKGTTATWSKPSEDWQGQLGAYQLRCSDVTLANGADQTTKDQWWQGAVAVVLPSGLTPATTTPTALLALRPEEPRNCVVRVEDIGHQLGPIVQSTDLTLKFRQMVLSSGTASSYLGYAVAAVGDVDGDKIDDLLVGGQGRAELIFGTKGSLASAKKVVFTGPSGGVGSAVIGLGDFNGDGAFDFAIGDPFWSGYTGRVSVFFGRPQAQWPNSPLDIETSCNADLCFEHADASAYMAAALGSAGDFNNDGMADLAIGSPLYPAFAGNGQLFVVLGGKYEVRSCGTCRATESCVAGTCQLNGGQTFWKMRFALPSGNWTDPPSGPAVPLLSGFQLTSDGSVLSLANSIASLGAFDAASGDDLAIGTTGSGKVFYLSGRAHSGGVGLDSLSLSDLGSPIATSATASFGTTVANLGNLYDVPGASVMRVDLGVGGSLIDQMFVAPGDSMTSSGPAFSANAITVSGPSSNIGQSIATGVLVFETPAKRLIGDIDMDGRADLLVGTRVSKDVMLWYADRFAGSITSATVNKSTGISVSLQAVTAQTAELAVQYLDFNGDGYPDVVVGDQRANSGQGQAVLLY